MKKVAVVILNWNGAGMLRRFLPLVLQNSGDEAAVYVADNGSDDESCALLQNEFPAVGLIRLDKNYGFAEGYNRALSGLEEPYFLLLNSDVEVPQGWLPPLLSYMEDHPEVGACQPKMLGWHSRDRFEYAGAAGGYIDALGYTFCRGRIFDVVERDEGQYDSVVPVFWASGAALMVRRTDWLLTGGLDGRFFAHMEEIDLCWRLRMRGRGVVCVPQSHVYHIGGATLKKENPRKTYLNFRNNLLMLYKDLPSRHFRRILFVRGMLDYVAAFKFLLSGDGANARAVWCARCDYARMRPQFKADRERNLAESVTAVIPERKSYSILWQYYARGRKKFSMLPY